MSECSLRYTDNLAAAHDGLWFPSRHGATESCQPYARGSPNDLLSMRRESFEVPVREAGVREDGD